MRWDVVCARACDGSCAGTRFECGFGFARAAGEGRAHLTDVLVLLCVFHPNARTLRVVKVGRVSMGTDLDERIADSQNSREDSQLVTAGGSRTIQTVSNLLRGERFSLQNFIHSVIPRC